MEDGNPLGRVTLIRRVAAFACRRTGSLVRLAHVDSNFRDAVRNYAPHLFKALLRGESGESGRTALFSACAADAVWLVDALLIPRWVRR